MSKTIKKRCAGFGLVIMAVFTLAASANAGMLVEAVSSHYGNFGGVDYLRHTGRFVGETSSGAFRVPFEIVAPANRRRGNGTVVVEPPHFIFGTTGRDSVLGNELLFERRFSYASVGFANEGFNLLDPFAIDAEIAGSPVISNMPPFLRDVEILKQFAEALSADPTAMEALGNVEQLYAYGVSQSAEAIYELFYGPGAEDLFDLTVLHVPLWRPAFARPDVLAVLPETFAPLDNVGKVMLVSAEGDLLISQSMQLRNASANSNYRLYEVAGAPHLAEDVVVNGVRTNPLDVAPMVRAAFVNGHRWLRWNRRPPASRQLDAAAPGEIDPIYWLPTGIARDANGNAAGGVRVPDVANGRALHIASALDIEVIPGLAGLIGLWFDLACAPPPGSTSAEPRFRSHRHYVTLTARQSIRLAWRGYLLWPDAIDLIYEAIASDVGEPGACG